jgi:hypothetical protein
VGDVRVYQHIEHCGIKGEGIGGTSKLGRGDKGKGGHPFLGERVVGLPHFSAGEKENMFIESILDASETQTVQKCSKIAQTSLLGSFRAYKVL